MVLTVSASTREEGLDGVPYLNSLLTDRLKPLEGYQAHEAGSMQRRLQDAISLHRLNH